MPVKKNVKKTAEETTAKMDLEDINLDSIGECCNPTKGGCHFLPKLLMMLLTVALVLGGVYMIVDMQLKNVGTLIADNIRKIEAQKVGGEANYKTLEKIYSSKAYSDQQKKTLEMAASQFGGGANAEEQTGDKQPDQQQSQTQSQYEGQGKMSKDDITALIGKSFVKGSKDAKITWIEYSDLECPACKGFHLAGTTKGVLAKYGNNVNYIFKNFPLSFHPSAKPAAVALECVGELAGADKYFDFIDKIYAGSSLNTETYVSVAKSLGANEAKFKSCIESKKYDDKIAKDMADGQEKFKISGTPGTILVNNATGEWIYISGGQQAKVFEDAIDKWLK